MVQKMFEVIENLVQDENTLVFVLIDEVSMQLIRMPFISLLVQFSTQLIRCERWAQEDPCSVAEYRNF